MLAQCTETWNSLPLWGKVAVGAGGVVLAGATLKNVYGVSQTHESGIICKNWKNDVVYLYQFPRSPYLPNASPFCLKLETFLRYAKIDYEVIGSMNHWSKEGKLPFIELNGVQYHDSDFAMEMLVDHFKLDHLEADLTDEQRGMTRAMFKLAEQSLCEAMIYNRFLENMDGFFKAMGFSVNFLQRAIVGRFLTKKIRARVNGAGIGRHSREEIYLIAKADLEAFSLLLGDNEYFFGNKPHTVDIIVWSVLCQSYYMPFDNLIRTYIITHFTNLDAFITRMKEHFWPDWDQMLLKKPVKI
uniref:Uncharacterized protein n=1 Tax=Plectus sambesii TaxID=2011161 RepID=A0A914UU73_9BILA